MHRGAIIAERGRDGCREYLGPPLECPFVVVVALLRIGIVWMGEHKSLQLKAAARSHVQIGLLF